MCLQQIVQDLLYLVSRRAKGMRKQSLVGSLAIASHGCRPLILNEAYAAVSKRAVH